MAAHSIAVNAAYEKPELNPVRIGDFASMRALGMA